MLLSSVDFIDYHGSMAQARNRSQRAVPGEDLHEIAGLIFGVSEQTRAVFERVVQRFDLSPSQARALMKLEKPVPMRFLAQDLRCDASNVTGIVDRLESRSLVRREPAQDDRRIKMLVLTLAGQRLRKRLEDAIHAASPVMTALSSSERKVFRTLLGKLAAASVQANHPYNG